MSMIEDLNAVSRKHFFDVFLEILKRVCIYILNVSSVVMDSDVSCLNVSFNENDPLDIINEDRLFTNNSEASASRLSKNK